MAGQGCETQTIDQMSRNSTMQILGTALTPLFKTPSIDDDRAEADAQPSTRTLKVKGLQRQLNLASPLPTLFRKLRY